MASSKKPLTKGQIVAHFAGKFDMSKKAAGVVVDEIATLAIAETKKADLNANDIDQAAKIIAGTARSMGITVE